MYLKAFIQNLVQNGSVVSEKIRFEFLYGHVTSIMSSDFHFIVPESFHTKFGSDQQSSF